MKKAFYAILIMVLFLSTIAFTSKVIEAQTTDIRLYKMYHGFIKLESQILTYNGRTYFPAREVFEKIGWNVAWHGDPISGNPPYVSIREPSYARYFLELTPEELEGIAPFMNFYAGDELETVFEIFGYVEPVGSGVYAYVYPISDDVEITISCDSSRRVQIIEEMRIAIKGKHWDILQHR